MLNVFITVDTEIWCDGWEDLDRKFPKYFNSTLSDYPKATFRLAEAGQSRLKVLENRI